MVAGNRLKLLFLEENSGDVTVVYEALKSVYSGKLEIEHFESIEEFLTLKTLEFDLILLGLNLKDSSGVETFRTVYRKIDDIPILLFTSFDDHDLAVQLLKDGAQDYLVKDSINGSQICQRIMFAIERKKIEKTIKNAGLKLKDQNFKISKILEEDRDAKAVISNNKEILFGNRQFTKLFGKPLGNIKESDLSIFESDEPYIYRKEGKILLDIHSIPITWDNEKCNLYTLYDITEKAEIEKQLLQSRKMEAIGNLAGGIAHDFNNLLTVITGYTEQLKNSSKDKMPDYIQGIKDTVDRGSSLARQLLVFSKRQVLIEKPVNVNKLMQNLVKMYRRLLRSSIHVGLEMQEPYVHIYGDPSQLEQILLNLVVNARDSIKGNGNIDLKICNNITLDDKEGLFCEISVRDNGEGIPEDLQEKIFEPYFTTKGANEGTGLGLAVIYGIVDQQGGKIVLDSKLGVGTTFRIYLKQMDEKTIIEDEKKIAQAELNVEKSILLVEDEPAILKLTKMNIESLGFKVYAATSVEDALICFKTNKKDISLLFTDIILTDGKGTDLAMSIFDESPECLCILTSGYAEDKELMKSFPVKRAHYLNKPYDIADIEALIGKKEVRNGKK